MTTPKKYRKKPVTIEAVQWTRNDPPRKLIDFTNGLVRVDDVEEVFSVYDRLHDVWVPFYWDDWIIKGIKGEFYPCRPDVFAASYEEVLGSTKMFDDDYTHDEYVSDEIFTAVYNPTLGIDLRYESWQVISDAIRDHLKTEELLAEEMANE